MKLKLTILLISLTTINCLSQENRSIISGNIYCFEKPVDDVHILNLSTKLGVISNKYGEFQLFGALNDTLLFSSLQYKKTKIVISENQIQNKHIVVQLYPLVNQLNEVYIEGLTGVLESDMNKVPEDTIPKISFVFDSSTKYIISKFDENKSTKKVNAQDFTDPIGPMVSSPLPDRKAEALRRFKKALKQKKDFPEKIKNELGIEYFTDVLKIPKDKINHFLSYCEYRNIIDKYHNDKQLEVIEILNEESVNYNKID